jgi:flagellar protein FliL
MAQAEQAEPPKGSKWMGRLVLGVVGLAAAGAGVAVPQLLPSKPPTPESASAHDAENRKPAFVPFGDVVVNLAEERLTRYLRVKLILVTDASQEKAAGELLTKNKAILKNWLISYLSDKSLQEVSGAAGVNRLRREIQDQFNALLYPDGSERIRDVLFEEFVVQ